jgi:multicomponent Na+:H+ antiporter subunit G
VIVEAIVSGLIILGSLCVLLAAVGIVRMPDVYTRLHASSKAATLGAIFVLAAAAGFFGGWGVAVKAFLAIVFLAITAPIGSHAIARAAYCAGVRMADADTIDELEGRYSPGTHRLDGTPD